MYITLNWWPDGVTLTATPYPKKLRFPPIKNKLVVQDGITYATPAGLFADKIALGTIPPEYKMVSADKYEIVFKNNKAPKEKKRKTYKR